MADRSVIEWTQATWNPTTGCDKVSTGCDNCYALALAARLQRMGSASISRTVILACQARVSGLRCIALPSTCRVGGAPRG